MSIKYSICSTNYNMVDTLEISLNSILTQIDERFEVIVVDGGSNDGSLDILKRLERKHKPLRVIESNRENSLGRDRQISIEKASGKYVLPQLDMDDYYYENVILDFVKIYHAIEEKIPSDIYLSGNGINITHKDVLMRVGGYRDLPPGAEDKDLWRRLISEDCMLILKSDRLCKKIGYEKTSVDSINRIFERVRGELKSGINLRSYFIWILKQITTERESTYFLYLLILPVAFLKASNKKELPLPSGVNEKGLLKKASGKKTYTFKKLQVKYGISLDKTDFSEKGKELFIGAYN